MSENPKEAEGRKKPSVGHIPPEVLFDWAAAHEFGAVTKGYGSLNWRKQPIKVTTYTDAIQRHLVAIMAGEDVDPESGLAHAAHIMASCAILIDAKERGTLIDNRCPEGEVLSR